MMVEWSHGNKQQAWWQGQEAEGSPLGLQTRRRERELQVENSAALSKPARSDGHASARPHLPSLHSTNWGPRVQVSKTHSDQHSLPTKSS